MIYSGNLNDFRRAERRLKALGFQIDTEVFRSAQYRSLAAVYRVWLNKEEVIKSPVFEHWDEDVLYNQVTAWMDKTATDLESWK